MLLRPKYQNHVHTMSAMCLIFKEVMVKVHVVDLKSENIAPPISVRAYLNQTITEFKQLISQVVFCSLLPGSHLPLLNPCAVLRVKTEPC